jgi:class 3 adenylate cyclase
VEPRIQYAKAKDGVSIAFSTLGEGMPIIAVRTGAVSHLQIEWQSSGIRRTFEALARRTKLVRYDPRGAGLSDRNVADRSIDAHVRDVEAVAGRLGLERFALLSNFQGGPVSIAYAARHPEQVSHLILWCSSHTTNLGPRHEALLTLAEQDWDLWLETVAHVVFGWSEGEEARQRAAQLRETLTQEEMRTFNNPIRGFDASELLPQVKAPTLVLHRRGVPFPSVDIAKTLASRIPNARLALLEGESLAPWVGDMDSIFEAINGFLSEGEEAEARAEPPETGAFRTILFTDVEGSTALTQRLGDARARDLLRQHERIVREALKAHGGSELKTTGDGFMASFSSATKALESAIAMQQWFAAHNESAEEPILVRVGLNAGEPIAEDEDLYGTAVNLAARIAGKAKGGEILTSDTVRGLVAGKQFLFADRGEVALKGFDEPVRLYEVRWEEEG